MGMLQKRGGVVARKISWEEILYIPGRNLNKHKAAGLRMHVCKYVCTCVLTYVYMS